ncbi:MAG: eL32 family ribosomal protein, partial [Candidatus Micrarchaeales archaeon]
RKQRGIDSKKRVKKAFAGAEPTIGYGNPESLRGVRVNGRKIVVVHNMNELKDVIGNPDMDEVDITLASTLSRRKRIELVKLADQNKMHVTNG